MPRQARLDYPGCLHHLINRGMERRSIFADKEDYKTFVDLLGRLVEDGGHKCYAWVLLPNHFHLLIETGRVPVARLMSRLSTSYAGHFNRRHRRAGRLFQNRYKSIVCDKDAYFQELVAYIHLNPLRAGLAGSPAALEKYPWSGHRALLGLEERPWQSVGDVLSSFGAQTAFARRRYLEYLAEKKDLKKGALSGGGLARSAEGLMVSGRRDTGEGEKFDSRVLGGGDFIAQALKAAGQTVKKAPAVSLDEMIKRVSEEMGVEPAELRKKGKSTKKAAAARAVVMELASRHLGLSLVEVAKRFHISQPAASILRWKGEKFFRENGDDVEHLLRRMGDTPV
jgi:REP element-mobilizing transposase RayT